MYALAAWEGFVMRVFHTKICWGVGGLGGRGAVKSKCLNGTRASTPAVFTPSNPPSKLMRFGCLYTWGFFHLVAVSFYHAYYY